jgi:KipI family sensor histidine kinase inhibitor
MSQFKQINPSTITRINEDAVLVDFTVTGESTASEEIQYRIWSLTHWIDQQRRELGILEAVPGMGNLLVQFQQCHRMSLTDLMAQQKTTLNLLQAYWRDNTQSLDTGKEVTIPVIYGGDYGPDIETVASLCGLPPSEIIARHCAAYYRVFFIGFQPGFAYLGGLDEALYCPRKTTPSDRIPAGSVAIGGSQTGIYPFASPGGWQIIGRTTMEMFNAERDPTSLLRAGDLVSFTQVMDT